MSSFLDEGLSAFDKMLGIEEEIPGDEPAESAAETPTEVPLADQLPEAPEAEAEAPEVEGRPRDESGRFAKKEEEPAEELPLLAGKFKSPEDLAKAYSELESRLGSQGSELGSLRETLERLNSNLERVEEEPEIEQAPIQVDPDWFEENLAENPQGMAYWAKENAPHLLGRVMKEWGEEDPFSAAQFVFDVRLQAMEDSFQKRLEESLQPVHQTTKQTAIEQAFAAAGVTPDANFVEAAKFAPEVAKGLTSQNADDRVRAVKALSYLAAGMSGLQQQTPAPAEPPTPAPQAAAQEAKLSGTVASQTQTGDAPDVSPGDQWLEDIGFDAYLDRIAPTE